MNLRRMAAPMLMLTFAAGLLFCPQECAAAARDGIALCVETVIPSLFPFFALSSLLISCGMAEDLGRVLSPLLQNLYRIGGSGGAALALGAVGGYPVGARTVAELYQNKLVSKTEAEHLLAFCNNAGPGFILGICGGAVFHSARIGAYLYLMHIASALLTGLIICRDLPRTRYSPYQRKKLSQSFAAAFPKAVTGALTSVLNVSAFVILFKVVLQLAFAQRASGIPYAALLGLVEMTSGVTALTATRGGFIVCAAILSWGGLSVHCQTLSVLADTDLDIKLYIRGKILQMAITSLLAWIITYRLF